MKFFIFVVFVILFSFIFLFLSYFLSFVLLGVGFSKVSPFECGFGSLVSHYVFFSYPFFLISLMFLLFDVEILLLCFFPLSFFFSSVSSVFSFLVVLVVLFSTLFEWAKGLLWWV